MSGVYRDAVKRRVRLDEPPVRLSLELGHDLITRCDQVTQPG
jgi:hypothetical protein